MKTEFVIALTQLAAERNLPKEVILKTVEAALVPIFKKTSFAPDQEVTVKILSQTGEVKVFARKTVVKRRTDPRKEMLLSEAKKFRPEASVGDVLEVECTPPNAGRIAAQTAKQVILQRLRDAERDAIFGEYADKENDIVSGVVHVIEAKHIIVDLGKAEAILPQSEQVVADHYRIGQRLRFYLAKVMRGPRGTQLVVSRTHQNLLRRLFELEIPEIFNGTVEIKSLAREPGYRSKVAVAARQEGVDAVGSCLGLRSIRIQNITKELSGEKIDVIQWHPDPSVFIANALSPATITKVEVDANEKSGNVLVPDKQLSLAIGKGGQNARLAARLTGWRIDIKSASMLEGGLKVEPAPVAAEAVCEVVEAPTLEVPEAVVEEVPVSEAEVEAPAEAVPVEEVEAEILVVAAHTPAEPEAPPEAAPEVEEEVRTYSIDEILSDLEVVTGRLKGRYASRRPEVISETKPKKAKKGTGGKEEEADGKPKAKRAVKRHTVIDDEEE